MKQNKLLYLIGETDDDLILDAAPNREKKNKNKWVKPLAFAASFVFLVSAALGGYAITAEAAEYREAVEFFEEHALSTEGLSREEIKKVYLDIKLQTFSYDKTVTAMLNGTISIKGYELLTNAPTSEDIYNYWNDYYTKPLDDKNGIYCHFVYPNDSELQFYKDGHTIWSTRLGYGMFDFTVMENGYILTYGQNDTTSTKDPRLAHMTMLDPNGNIVWEKTLMNGFHNEDISKIICEGDTFAVFGRGDYHTFLFSRYDMDGNRLVYQATPVKETLVIWNVVPFSEGYLVQFNNYDKDGFAKLVKVGHDGTLTDSFSYGADGAHYFLKDMIEHGGKLYLSTYAVPKVDDNAGGREEIAPIFQKIHETFGRDVFSIPSEDLTPIVRDNYTAVLLICDTESGNVGEFYSVEGARGGKLSVSEDGKLVWEAESFVDTFYSLATSSFTIGGTCRIYRYTFDANGALIGAEKTDDYTIYRQ